LVEDTMAVGDVVTVAGKGGVVEWMSLRAIRLRDFDGTLHTVPFSEIATVSNLTKDFAYAVFRVNVAYDADIGRVQEIIRDVMKGMRADPTYASMILEDVEVFGIDNFGDSAITVLARVKVAPAAQWSVTRGFQGLLKEAFDREGIEIPFPQRTLWVRREPNGQRNQISRGMTGGDGDTAGTAEPRSRT
jgi:small conductance mechanosensitive channel